MVGMMKKLLVALMTISLLMSMLCVSAMAKEEKKNDKNEHKSQGGLKNAGRVSSPEKRAMCRNHKSVQRKRGTKAAIVPGTRDQLQHVHALAEEPAK